MNLTTPVDCGPASSPCFLHIDSFVLPNVHDAPVVVMIPGGPLQIGHRDYLWTLARWVAARGLVVFTADYRSGPEFGGAFPQTFADVACAIRFARANGGQLGGDPTRITLVAHSLGGFPGSVLSLSPHDYATDEPACTARSGTGRPDAFVGIAGVYALDQIGGDFLAQFFGGPRSGTSGDGWNAGDALLLAKAPGSRVIPMRLAVGSLDATAPLSYAQELIAALRPGADATITTMDGATHESILSLRSTVDLVEATAKGS